MLEPLIELGYLRLWIHLRLVLIIHCILEHSILLRRWETLYITCRYLLRQVIINLCWLLHLLKSVKVLELLVLHNLTLVWKVLLSRSLCNWGCRGSVEGLTSESKLLASSARWWLIQFPFVGDENLNIGCCNWLLRGLCLDLLIIVSIYSCRDLLVDHFLYYFWIYLASKNSRQDLLSLRKVLLYLRINWRNRNLRKRIQLLKWIYFRSDRLLILIEIGCHLWNYGLRYCLSYICTNLLNSLGTSMTPSDPQNFFVWYIFNNLTGGDSSLAIDPLPLNCVRVLNFHDMLERLYIFVSDETKSSGFSRPLIS